MSNRNCVSVSYDDIEISSLASRSKSCSDESWLNLALHVLLFCQFLDKAAEMPVIKQMFLLVFPALMFFFWGRLESSDEDETCREQSEKEYISPLRGTRE